MTYLANDKYNSNLSQGYTVGDTTLYVDAVPTNVPTIVVANYGESDETVFNVTGKTSNSLTGVSRRSGANTNLSNGATITCLNNDEYINQYQTAIFSAENLKSILYGADGGSSDTYVASLNPAPTSYTNLVGVPISIFFNTANTGAATLNLNSLGAKDIKKQKDVALETGDIKAGQICLVIYDGTNFQLIGFTHSVTVNRAFSWYIDGTAIVQDEAGAKYIVPQNMTVVAIRHKTVSGTATIRLQKGTTDIDASISVTSTGASETSITSAALTAGDVLTLDVTAASSPVGLTVTMECTQP